MTIPQTKQDLALWISDVNTDMIEDTLTDAGELCCIFQDRTGLTIKVVYTGDYSYPYEILLPSKINIH